jgi:hypothetical protein
MDIIEFLTILGSEIDVVVMCEKYHVLGLNMLISCPNQI